MATVYVSNSTLNGYASGNDSNTYAQMQNKATPALTLTGAYNRAVAGDTIVINDGTYNESNYIMLEKINLVINAQNDYQAIIKAASGTTRVLHQMATATGLNLGKIVLDAQNTQINCVTQDSSNDVASLTINGTRFVNFTSSGLNLQHCVNLTMDGNWSVISTVSGSSAAPINLTNTATGTISIKNGSFNINTTAGKTGPLYCINAISSASGSNLIVQNIIQNYGSANPAINITGIMAIGFTTYDISKNTLTETTLQNSSGGYDGVWIKNSAIAATKCWIYNNTFNGGNPNPATNASGHNICIGDDSDSNTNANSINGVWVYGNKCYNMNHQILLGWVTKGIVTGNLCDNGVIGVIGKHTTNCLFTGNILKNITTGGSLRMKASTGDVFTNNTVIITSASAVAMLATASVNPSSGGSFKNNIIYMYGVVAQAVSVYDDSSTATFTNNDYYSTVGENTYAYQSNTYNNFAAWKSAQETSALNINPAFVNYPSDLRVLPTSGLYHAGVFAGNDNKDFRLRPFNIKPTIGAYEVTSGDLALTRNPRAA